MQAIIGWDTETHLIENGNLTPELVCASFAGGQDTLDAARHFALENLDSSTGIFAGAVGWSMLVSKDKVVDVWCYFAQQGYTLVAHNHPYDLGVITNECPDLIPVVLHLMEEGRLRDTQVREQLIAIAEDNFNFDDRTGKKPGRFSLAYLAELYFGENLYEDKKDPNSWRLRYAELSGVSIHEWPEKAKSYAMDDAHWCRKAYLQQAKERSLPEGVLVDHTGTVTNEIEQTAAALSLHLMACHGVYTDSEAVRLFEKQVLGLAIQADAAAEMAGFLRVNKCKTCEGTGVPELSRSGLKCYECAGERGYVPRRCKVPLKKTGIHKSRLQSLVTKSYGGDPPLTNPSTKFPLGQVKTDSDTLKGSGNSYLEKYAEGVEYKKLLTTYLPILQSGVDKPITSSPNVLVRSGRTSWRAPNFQNPPRKGGFRECFVPREGKVFAAIDYSSLELCTLAQVNLHLFNYSKMAEALIEGRDLHLAFAAQLLNISYEEAMGRREEGDKAIKKARQDAKAGNFGFPGGLGIAAFVDYASSMGIPMTFNRAQDLKDQWMETWPEMTNYFDMIAHASDTSDTGRFTVKQMGSDRLRGGCSYTSGANTFFQGLASDGCKSAMWYLTKAMYSDTSSPLYGVRCWAFIHDEFLLEGPEETSHLWAPEASAIMVREMRKYTPDIPIKAEPALMRRWYKDAESKYDEDGNLIIWR
jgi:DNA polymerase-1